MSQNFSRTLSDERLVEVVQAMDRVNNPLSRRMEGDDTAIVELMEELGLTQNLANKMMINGEVLRECAHRGLQIPRSNEPTSDSDVESGYRPKF